MGPGQAPPGESDPVGTLLQAGFSSILGALCRKVFWNPKLTLQKRVPPKAPPQGGPSGGWVQWVAVWTWVFPCIEGSTHMPHNAPDLCPLPVASEAQRVDAEGGPPDGVHHRGVRGRLLLHHRPAPGRRRGGRHVRRRRHVEEDGGDPRRRCRDPRHRIFFCIRFLALGQQENQVFFCCQP